MRRVPLLDSWLSSSYRCCRTRGRRRRSGPFKCAVPERPAVALKSKVIAKTRAIYLVNPHNPTGTINDDEAFKSFLRETSKSAVVVVDEAYLEYPSVISALDLPGLRWFARRS